MEHDTSAPIMERTALTLEQAAVREAGMVNWYANAGPERGKLFVQWCHGAAGIVTALGRTAKDGSPASLTIDRLLKQAGELVWQAGPLVKGPGLCHGTAGNGYALLALYRRTGKPIWLRRARRFAAHAIHQCRRNRADFCQGRHSLPTGDLGLAVYLRHCLEPSRIRMPGLEQFA